MLANDLGSHPDSANIHPHHLYPTVQKETSCNGHISKGSGRGPGAEEQTGGGEVKAKSFPSGAFTPKALRIDPVQSQRTDRVVAIDKIFRRTAPLTQIAVRLLLLPPVTLLKPVE